MISALLSEHSRHAYQWHWVDSSVATVSDGGYPCKTWSRSAAISLRISTEVKFTLIRPKGRDTAGAFRSESITSKTLQDRQPYNQLQTKQSGSKLTFMLMWRAPIGLATSALPLQQPFLLSMISTQVQHSHRELGGPC